MEYHVLGPLEIVRDGRTLELGAGKQRTLLAVLLLHANEVVSTDRLIDALWGEQTPATAPKIVQGYVSRLRKVLDGDHERREQTRPPRSEGALLTRSPGYVLRVDEGQLDSARFATLLAQAQATLARGAASEAATVLREALGLWRGPPLADFAFDAFAQEEIARLGELHLAGVEERVEADLALGRHAEVVAELESLVARYPLRERLRGQRMLALYRCGRQAEALEVYQDARRMLVDELGLEPSRRLRELEQAILRQDPSLDASGLRAARSESRSTGSVEPAVELQPWSVFVGRDGELASLSKALDDAVGGHGRLVMVGGEPGIGKSRLAEELASQAVKRGGTVLWGRCWEAGGAPPYWPWVQAIRFYVREADAQLLLEELGAGASDIADVVVDVRQRFPDIGPAHAIDDLQIARFHLFDSITAFLTSVSRTQPLVLVLDDLHWADEGSLRLLEFAARELSGARLLVVGTYRDVELSRRHPLTLTLAELSRERSFERIVLRGLDRDAVSRFVEAACGTAPPSELVDAVHAHTEGNPFFVTQIVRLLAQEGALTAERLSASGAWGIRIPEGVREAIGRRLDHLSDACNQTLAVASIIGREFSLVQLNGLVEDVSTDMLLDLLEEALSARVIEESPTAPGRYQFTHALIQETLAAELSLTRRVRLHRRIADGLEELYGKDADLHAPELAHHFGEAQTLVGPAKFVRYSLVAGEAALAAYAHEQALAYFERALSAKGDAEADEETAALYFGRGRAQLGALPRYELEPASTSLRRAFDYYARAGDVSRAVAVAAHPVPLSLGLGYTSFPDLIARALDFVAPDSHEAGRLLAQHGWYCGIVGGNHGEAHRAFRRALSIAKRQNDGALERRTLANAAWVDVWHFRPQDCLREGLRAIELGGQAASDEQHEIVARRSIIWALMGSGQRAGVAAHTVAGFALAQKVRDRWSLSSAGFDVARLAVYEGDWETARAMSDAGSEAQPRDPRALAMRALLEYECGNFDTGAAYVARLQEVSETVPVPGPIAEHAFLAGAISITARIADSDERLDSAAASATALLSMPRLVPALALVARTASALIAVQRRDAERAERDYRAIEPHKGSACFIIPLTFDRLLGLLAATADQVDRALMHYEEGLAFCDRAGYRPEYAWTACDYADALLTRNHPADKAKATALQDAAREIASELGMRPVIDRCARRARTPRDQAPPP